MDASFTAARQNLNTIRIMQRGFVWIRFLSSRGYPIGGVSCALTATGKSWETKKTSPQGEVRWGDLALLDYTVQMNLGGRSLDVPAPWLRQWETIHVDRLYDSEARQLLGDGDCPFALQVRLNGLGYNCGAVDGAIGPKTKKAVRQFQKDRGLTVDGLAGPATQGYLSCWFEGGDDDAGESDSG
jgi:Putative peptidoglycan binding domain